MPQAFKIPILHTRIVQPMNSLTASPNNKKLIYTTTAKSSIIKGNRKFEQLEFQQFLQLSLMLLSTLLGHLESHSNKWQCEHGS